MLRLFRDILLEDGFFFGIPRSMQRLLFVESLIDTEEFVFFLLHFWIKSILLSDCLHIMKYIILIKVIDQAFGLIYYFSLTFSCLSLQGAFHRIHASPCHAYLCKLVCLLVIDRSRVCPGSLPSRMWIDLGGFLWQGFSGHCKKEWRLLEASWFWELLWITLYQNCPLIICFSSRGMIYERLWNFCRDGLPTFYWFQQDFPAVSSSPCESRL